MTRSLSLLFLLAAFALCPLSQAQVTSFVDVDGDGVNDLKLESDWSKNSFEWAATKYSWVTNLTNQVITYDWPVGGQSGKIQPGKRSCIQWTSWTMIFLGTGDIAAQMGANVKKQKSSAYNCISDIAKDWKASTATFGTSSSIPGSTNPTVPLQTSYSINGQVRLTAVSTFQEPVPGQFVYMHSVQNQSNAPITLQWYTARNNGAPNGVATTLGPGQGQTFSYPTNSPPDFYDNVIHLVDGDGNDISLNAPAWVPTNELNALVGGNSTNPYLFRSHIETWESYPTSAALNAAWPSFGSTVDTLEQDLDGNDAASNVNNEPPSVGLGTGLLLFNGVKAVRLTMSGIGGINRNLPPVAGPFNGVVVWAEVPNADTIVNVSINGITSTNPLWRYGLTPVMQPEVGGFVGYHFARESFPGWNGSQIQQLSVQFSSTSPQTVFVDEIDSVDPMPASTVGITAFCFGDGSLVPCPCNNNGAAGHGCNNSSNTGGSIMTASGAASLSADTLQFTASGEKPTATSIFLQGNAQLGIRATFGQGLRCAGGILKRLYVKNAIGGTVVAPTGADPSVHLRSAALGDPIPAGSARYYQTYYRDPTVLGGCPPNSTFNVSEALAVIWSL
jgi:hypothetical protein